MPNQITKAEREAFLNGLADDQRGKVQQLLSTVALQAEVIDDLMVLLDIWEGGESLKKKTISGISLATLAAKLTDPIVRGPTLEEVNQATRKMQQDIQNAATAQAVFSHILGFALKIAPLVI
jgi:hypothetical protein